MGELSWDALKQFVYEHASGCCECCQTCEENIGQTMQVDHIDPQGGDVLENLCLSCWNCNSSKHKATVVTDAETGERVPLFNPRMQVWAEHFTKLRLQKIFNLFQDPYERADITSNTFWDWQLNHVGSMYGVMDDVVQFATTFKEFPPRSTPPSFNPATLLEGVLHDVKVEQKIRERFPLPGGPNADVNQKK